MLDGREPAALSIADVDLREPTALSIADVDLTEKPRKPALSIAEPAALSTTFPKNINQVAMCIVRIVKCGSVVLLDNSLLLKII